jgi:hypothetical protein
VGGCNARSPFQQQAQTLNLQRIFFVAKKSPDAPVGEEEPTGGQGSAYPHYIARLGEERKFKKQSPLTVRVNINAKAMPNIKKLGF